MNDKINQREWEGLENHGTIPQLCAKSFGGISFGEFGRKSNSGMVRRFTAKSIVSSDDFLIFRCLDDSFISLSYSRDVFYKPILNCDKTLFNNEVNLEIENFIRERISDLDPRFWLLFNQGYFVMEIFTNTSKNLWSKIHHTPVNLIRGVDGSDMLSPNLVYASSTIEEHQTEKGEDQTEKGEQRLTDYSSLPRDIKYLIINEYVDPRTALAFLCVSKEYNNNLNRLMIVKRYLTQRTFEIYSNHNI